MAKKLSAKRQRFVEEYVVDSNATQAAIRAGYSERTAYSQGERLLRDVEVASAIRARAERIAGKAEISAERVMKQLAAIAFGDIGELMTWDEDRVTFVPSDDLTPEQRAAISAVKAKVEGYAEDGQVIRSLEIKRADQLRALELIGRRLSLWQDKTAVTLDLGELAGRSADELEAMAKALRGGGS